jgi:hypothetical protein
MVIEYKIPKLNHQKIDKTKDFFAIAISPIVWSHLHNIVLLEVLYLNYDLQRDIELILIVPTNSKIYH